MEEAAFEVRRMESNTESKGWDSRFASTSSAGSVVLTPSQSTGQTNVENTLQDVLMLVRNEIPFAEPEFLRFNSHIGHGSSFDVSKELFGRGGEQPYFVAVKRLVIGNESKSTNQPNAQLGEYSKRLVSVKREVRVLTHPKVRSHSCLLSAIAWGWEPDPWIGNKLYLIMPYSQHGTLSTFAQKRSLNLIDRRYLALDVALGIRALHDCDIVHGDVKPENVLVYGYSVRDKDEDRHYIAKLADFGCSLFKEDIENHQGYLGTPKYNAPEICGWGKEREHEDESLESVPILSRYKSADCYSFGLLLWETIKQGKSFVEPKWLKADEKVMGWLERTFQSKENGLLEFATTFFRSREEDLIQLEEKESKSRIGIYPSNPTRAEMGGYFGSWPQLQRSLDAIDAPPDSESFKVFETTVCLCLQEIPRRRGSIHQIVKTLSEGIDDAIPQGENSTEKILPVETRINGESTYAASRFKSLLTPMYDTSPQCKGLYLDSGAPSCSSKHLKSLPRDAPADPALQLTRIPVSKRYGTLVLTPEVYRYKSEDMFKSVLRRQPPWYNQYEAAKAIQDAIDTESDPKKEAQAHLQMAIMCHVGYGVAPDSPKALKHLEAASKKNEVARAIFNRVCATLQPDRQNGHFIENCIPYRNPVILLDSLIWRDSSEEGNDFLTLGPISVDSFRKFEILVKKGRYDSGELAQAFTAACRDGHLEAAMVLAKHCADLSAVDDQIPNYLHWLIMFNEREACDLLKLISTSSNGGTDAIKLDGIQRLLATEHENLTVMLPHRCVELRGTPVHWAVTAGYCDLVADFLCLGADVNLRTKWRKTPHQDGFTEHVPSLSPLDLAVAGHHHMIVELLLDNGSETYGGDWHWSLSPFHMIGYNIFPFGKYVTHGAKYRTALRETIQVLRRHDLDINVLDNQNQTPLSRAVRNMDLESYVIEELIAAGATVVDECVKEHGNFVVMAMMDCAHRKLSWSKIPLLLPLVSDINGLTPGNSGLNALHYSAIFDAAPAAEILLRVSGIDVETKSPQGATAVDLAAQRGSLDVLGQLIKHGANIQGREPLQLSISLGQIDALDMLLNAGADTQWKNRDNRTITCLGYAVRIRSQRPSYVRACLSKCKRLQSQKIIDQDDDNNWTALHFAAYYGDLEGVQALIEYGARVDKRTSSVNLTPLELAIKTYEELRVYFVGVPHFTSHPRIKQDIDGLERNSLTYPGMARRIETNFSDSLFEVIRLLQQVERDRFPRKVVLDISRSLGKVQPEGYLSQKEIRNHQRDLAFAAPRWEREAEIKRKGEAAKDLELTEIV
ncbi:hypothetical protein KAF25_002498 [Fusarium avenaceum]|uniref:Protein kinase domain-containing protein n=1 Tax=Fusarium avenaceum TaxID=40199 RepID=A0A9P7KTV8_9HYPO|nr:hypothetical protein KAF25_002498 [Fusarium avenaceum]